MRLLAITKKVAIILITIIAVASVIGIFAIVEVYRSQNRIILATTTSTSDSGLLDYLLPTIFLETGVDVQVVSVGTGQAITTAQNGDADVILVHARSKEDKFVADGYGVNRTCVMYNDFVLIGPVNDPAGIKDADINTAMSKLKAAGEAGTIKFYSRGDNSGTYTKELALWTAIGYTPDANANTWYLETGAGMGDTLITTNENDGYTLIDRGTWLSQKSTVDLVVLVEGDVILLNPYGAILVNPAVHPTIKIALARKFVAWLVSERGQTMIGDYKVGGEVLFNPDFGICDDTTGCKTTAQEVEIWKIYNGGYTGPST